MAASPKVSLRDFERDDAAAVHRWFNNERAIRTLMEERESFSEDDARTWVERAMDDSGEDRKYAIVVEGHDEPAKRVVASLGWRHEGTMRAHIKRGGELHDCELWGVLPDEFRDATSG